MVIRQSDNSIIIDGHPYQETLKVEVATSMFPGRLVKRGTNADDIVCCVAGDHNPVGWLGYHGTIKGWQPATVNTIYLINAQVCVLSGVFRMLATLALGQVALKGDPLVPANAGMLQVASAMTVTIATGTIAVVSDKAQPDEIVVGAYGSEGRVVAKAEEDMDASNAALDIAILAYI